MTMKHKYPMSNDTFTDVIKPFLGLLPKDFDYDASPILNAKAAIHLLKLTRPVAKSLVALVEDERQKELRLTSNRGPDGRVSLVDGTTRPKDLQLIPSIGPNGGVFVVDGTIISEVFE